MSLMQLRAMVPDVHFKTLRYIAKHEDVSLSHIVRRAIRIYLKEKYNDKIEKEINHVKN